MIFPFQKGNGNLKYRVVKACQNVLSLLKLFLYLAVLTGLNPRQCVYHQILKLEYVASNIGEGNGTPLQYSCLENPMDRGAWQAAVHGVAKSRSLLSDFTFTFMHWRRKWQPTPVFLPGESQGGEPGGLPCMGLHRVGHD